MATSSNLSELSFLSTITSGSPVEELNLAIAVEDDVEELCQYQAQELALQDCVHLPGTL